MNLLDDKFSECWLKCTELNNSRDLSNLEEELREIVNLTTAIKDEIKAECDAEINKSLAHSNGHSRILDENILGTRNGIQDHNFNHYANSRDLYPHLPPDRTSDKCIGTTQNYDYDDSDMSDRRARIYHNKTSKKFSIFPISVYH